MEPIDVSKILVVPKMSGWAREQADRALSQNKLMAAYAMAGRSYEGALASHIRQQESIALLRKLFTPQQFISREQLTPDVAAEASLIIVPGGDNHLQYVAGHVKNTPVVAVNSDPQSSFGGTIDFLANEIENMLPLLESGEYELVNWPRLQVLVDSQPVRYAVSEVTLAAPLRKRASRVLYDISGHSTQRAVPGSGVLISTGVGISGHFSSAGLYLPLELRREIVAKCCRRGRTAAILVTEPFLGKKLDFEITPEIVEQQLLFSYLEDGQEVVLRSIIPEGSIAIDGERDIPFPRDTIARVSFSDRPLLVLVNPLSESTTLPAAIIR